MNRKEVTVYGKTFNTTKELCKFHNISERTYRYRTNVLGLSPADAVVYHGDSIRFVVRGVPYASQQECLDALDIKRRTLRKCQQENGMSFREAVENILSRREEPIRMNQIPLFRK